MKNSKSKRKKRRAEKIQPSLPAVFACFHCQSIYFLSCSLSSLSWELDKSNLLVYLAKCLIGIVGCLCCIFFHHAVKVRLICNKSCILVLYRFKGRSNSLSHCHLEVSVAPAVKLGNCLLRSISCYCIIDINKILDARLIF